MNYFLSDQFVLSGPAARALYHSCQAIPVFDYHNHLSPKLLYENPRYRSLADFWLTGDHYIWRAMRLGGVEERCITGDAPDKEKYLAWVRTLDSLVGCPLYVWIQMQMAVLFGEEEPLCSANAEAVYDRCGALLETDAFRPRQLLERFHVKALCTTDEPFDSLEWHEKLQREVPELLVLPAFRPDKLLNLRDGAWRDHVAHLAESEGVAIQSLGDLEEALRHSLDRFAALGCRTADHGYEGLRYGSPEGAEAAFSRAMQGEALSDAQMEAVSSHLLRFLGAEYARRNMVMQLHLGALRNGNTRRYRLLGADCGVDSADDWNDVRSLARFLDTLEQQDALPRTILYCLDDAKYTALCTLSASFAGGGVKNRVQVGSAWWFNDHERGMRQQLTALMENAMLPGFVGMLTDSRSIGSFVRHDYFRRILCDLVGSHVDKGEFPLEQAKTIVANICCQNALDYFNINGN